MQAGLFDWLSIRPSLLPGLPALLRFLLCSLATTVYQSAFHDHLALTQEIVPNNEYEHSIILEPSLRNFNVLHETVRC